MKKLYLLACILFFFSFSQAQTIIVAGQCMSGNITLSLQSGNIDGKPYYEGFGTVDGNTGVQVDIFWIGAPDNVWVLAFDGQPYYQSTCPSNLPPATANVNCTWSLVSGQACTGPGGPLSITGAAILPVTLTDFRVTRAGRDVMVNWTTSAELNNRGFYIQRSSDGTAFTDIGFVNGHNNTSVPTSYSFTDHAPLSGRNVYRLRQVDLDGVVTYSSLAIVEFDVNGFFSISDNPGKGIYKISMQAGTEKIDIQVVNAAGKVLVKKSARAGNQVLDISGQAAGIYILQVKKGDNVFTEKLIKL